MKTLLLLSLFVVARTSLAAEMRGTEAAALTMAVEAFQKIYAKPDLRHYRGHGHSGHVFILVDDGNRAYSCPMARMPRVEFDGALYHLLCRGDRREAIFLDDKDREMFLATLEGLMGVSQQILTEAH